MMGCELTSSMGINEHHDFGFINDIYRSLMLHLVFSKQFLMLLFIAMLYDCGFDITLSRCLDKVN